MTGDAHRFGVLWSSRLLSSLRDQAERHLIGVRETVPYRGRGVCGSHLFWFRVRPLRSHLFFGNKGCRPSERFLGGGRWGGELVRKLHIPGVRGLLLFKCHKIRLIALLRGPGLVILTPAREVLFGQVASVKKLHDPRVNVRFQTKGINIECTTAVVKRWYIAKKLHYRNSTGA